MGLLKNGARIHLGWSALALITGWCCLLCGGPSALAQNLRPITHGEFEDYLRWLRFDDEQARIANAFFADYEELLQREYSPRLKEHYALVDSAMLAESRPAEHGFKITEPWETAYESAGTVRALLNQYDQGFFESLQALLNESQTRRMQRVRLGRLRVIYAKGRGELPEGNVDLISLVERLNLTAEERERADLVIEEFEPRFVSTLTALEVANRDGRLLMRKGHEAMYRLKAGAHTATEQSRLKREQERFARASGLAMIGFAQKLVMLNRQGLQLFVEALSPESALQLSNEYLRLAYPEAYPDHGSAARLFRAALEIETLDEAQRDQVRVFYDTWRREHERLTKKLCEAIYARRHVSRLQSNRGPTLIDMWQRQQEVGERREQLNARQIAYLRPLLTMDQLASLPSWDFEIDPPYRAWDPRDKRESPARIDRAKRVAEEARRNYEERTRQSEKGGDSDKAPSHDDSRDQ